MKFFIIDLLAKSGCWCCRKSIDLAGRGCLNFEVEDYEYNPILNNEILFVVCGVPLFFFFLLGLLGFIFGI
jgi:hypothetical protein